ncbi:50S ribosomal protein L25/general stress protein Ctc [Calderihabitans maritimus]|uniref:Large ribosomal subunit protein bL25 n=1 Tax=Calderihabitans maritimus TaxID=1246530 RepID=A0A1Z5HQS2_9FIRM|nr:50S ribosomal protein L25/general stress protein Ctc [Calderihabitans maritimus]GAW91661.1 ribosomal protein L25 [Calderihabitans maritimus]
MEAVQLEAKIREGKGKGFAKRLRRAKFIPAVLYGKKIGNIPIQVGERDMEKLLSDFGRSVLVKLKVNDGDQSGEYDTLIREIQRHPLRGDLLHVDFYQISLQEKLEVEVPIHLVGEAVGVSKGGILQHGISELEIRCLPTQIPEAIEVDVSNLDIGDSLSVADLKLDDDIEILSEPDSIIATVVAPRLETEEDKEAEEATEAASPAEE